jgi:hypothetical protein
MNSHSSVCLTKQATLWNNLHLAQVYMNSSCSALPALKPGMGLGLLHGIFCGGFARVNFFAVGSLPPHPIPKLDDKELRFVQPLPFGMGGTTRSLRSR